jgi:hypothetical protein
LEPAPDAATPVALATGGVVTEPPVLPSESGTETVIDPAATWVLPPGRYRFTYRDTTIYAAHGVTAAPGDVHDWPDGPPNDGRWTPATEGE